MGAGNAVAVMLYHRRLDHRAMRLLTHMALVSMDPGEHSYPVCLYWGRPEDQAAALGWKDRNPAFRDRELRAIRAQLVAAGAIVRVRGSARRRSPTWEVITDPIGGPRSSLQSSPTAELGGA